MIRRPRAPGFCEFPRSSQLPSLLWNLSECLQTWPLGDFADFGGKYMTIYDCIDCIAHIPGLMLFTCVLWPSLRKIKTKQSKLRRLTRLAVALASEFFQTPWWKGVLNEFRIRCNWIKGRVGWFRALRSCEDLVFAYGPKTGEAFLRFCFCVQRAMEWTASVHTWHMSKPVITFVFKVVRNELLWYILDTCPNLW